MVATGNRFPSTVMSLLGDLANIVGLGEKTLNKPQSKREQHISKDEWLVGNLVPNMRTWDARARSHLNKCLTALPGHWRSGPYNPLYSWKQNKKIKMENKNKKKNKTKKKRMENPHLKLGR